MAMRWSSYVSIATVLSFPSCAPTPKPRDDDGPRQRRRCSAARSGAERRGAERRRRARALGGVMTQ